MPFTQTCIKYVGQNLLVLPYYGHGWGREDTTTSPKEPLDSLGPEPFHMRAEEFFKCDDQLVGIGGIIMEKGHPFEGYYCVCCLRQIDDFDFTTNPGHYLIWLAQKRPHIQPSSLKAIYEWVTPDKSLFCLCGYGTVAESVHWIQDIYKRTMDSRKLVGGHKT